MPAEYSDHAAETALGSEDLRDESATAFEAARGGSFEERYAAVGDRLDLLPWAELTAHPSLVAWLDTEAASHWPTLTDAGAGADDPTGTPTSQPPSAVVVGCGLGDDAAELAARGFAVTAFDFSPTAVGWARRRFPDSTATFEVLDLFEAPAALSRTFDLVVEIYTVQSLPPESHATGIETIAGLVAQGGLLFARCFGRDDDEPAPAPPRPLSPSELAGYEAAGLTLVYAEEGTNDEGRRIFQRIYRRR